MSPNRFGLPPLSESPESHEARAKRVSAVTQLAREVFTAAVTQLGMNDAKKVWEDVSRRKRGRPNKSELSGWDPLLLEMYDQLSGDPNPQTLIRHMAKFLYDNNHRIPTRRHWFASPEAIERRIRRLLAERSAS
jgi:hypothetical protein